MTNELLNKLIKTYEDKIEALESEVNQKKKLIEHLRERIIDMEAQIEDAEFIINSEKDRLDNKVMSVDENGEIVYHNTKLGNYFAYKYTADKLRNEDVNELVKKCLDYMDSFEQVIEYLKTSKGIVLDEVLTYFEKQTIYRKMMFLEHLNHPIKEYKEEFHNPFIKTFLNKVEKNGILETLNRIEYREYVSKEVDTSKVLLASTCKDIPVDTICSIYDENNTAEWKVIAQEGDMFVLRNIKLSAKIIKAGKDEIFPKSLSIKVE